MIGFAAQTIGTAIALWLTSLIYAEISFGKDASAGEVLVVAIVVGLANALVKPVLKLLSLPLSMMTLGLSGLLVNAVVLLGVAWVAGELKIPFVVGGFPGSFSTTTIVAAIAGAAVLSIVSLLIDLLPFVKTSR
ncbi:MAG TPA: phage holin family protein [Candidatus Limnocylindrales bacterium]